MFTVYARLEPTDDSVLLAEKKARPALRLTRRHCDVQVYRDDKATERFARIPWHYTKPTKRQKTITLNCVRWKLVWLPPHENAPTKRK